MRNNFIFIRRSGRSVGFSLIELMIALVLGSLLTLGAATLYGQSKRSSAFDEQSALMQENARYLLRLFTREITMSGYSAGILNLDSVTVGAVTNDCGVDGVNWALDPSVPMEFVDDITSTINTTHKCITDAESVDDTDLLVIKRTADRPTVQNGSFVSGTTALDSDQWYMRVENNGNDVQILKGNTVAAGDYAAGSGVDLWEYKASIYYISPNSSGTDGIPSLCMSRLQSDGMSARQCLIEGVENLQFEFGLDVDGDEYPEEYITNPTAAQMETAVTIRVHLLARSPYPLPDYTDQKLYVLPSGGIAPIGDKYIRRIYTTTVKIRNVRSLS